MKPKIPTNLFDLNTLKDAVPPEPWGRYNIAINYLDSGRCHRDAPINANKKTYA